MKKLWLMLATVALVGWTASTLADVQNIRLSGDIRLRGYHLDNVAGDLSPVNPKDFDENNTDDSFVNQRTRVTVEADLEDHVLVVVTLQAEGLWGQPNESTKTWDTGVSEAYLQLNEVFYTPATLKLGRQYLHYGRGLIISSVDQAYNFDAARLVLDWYPFVLDIVGSFLTEGSSFGANDDVNRSSYMLFANGRFEFTDKIIKSFEVYAGYVINDNPDGINFPSSSWSPPTVGGASPIIIGGRVDITPAEAISLWAEGAYEVGADGSNLTTPFLGSASLDEHISAFILNAGGRVGLGQSAWAPALNFNYIYASGGGAGGEGTFRPWFAYMENYNGYLFHPLLSDIQVINLGFSAKPWENTTMSLQGYYYLKADADGFVTSDPNIDFGTTGIFEAAGTGGREIGWEVDQILTYDYSKDVRCQLVNAFFIPNNLHGHNAYDRVAHEIRGEINVKF